MFYLPYRPGWTCCNAVNILIFYFYFLWGFLCKANICSQASPYLQSQVIFELASFLTGASQCQDETQGYRESLPFSRREPNKAFCVRELFKNEVDADGKHCSCSTQGSGAKRIWEASLSSLKSKKIKGSHLVDCPLESIWDIALDIGGGNSCYQTAPLAASENKSSEGLPRKDITSSCTEKVAEGCAPANTTLKACVRRQVHSDRECFKIVLMNIADDNKKAHLEKVHPA